MPENREQPVENILKEALQQPHSVQDDAGIVTSHKLSDQIMAVKFLKQMEAAQNPLSGIGLFQTSTGGTVIGGDR